MSDTKGRDQAVWLGPDGIFAADARIGTVTGGTVTGGTVTGGAPSTRTAGSATGDPQPDSAGAGFTVDPLQLVRLADQVGALPEESMVIRLDLSATLEWLPPAAFGLVAESNDAYMAYRRRTGAANTEFEAADLELQQMSDDVAGSAAGYRWQDRQVAEDYARLSAALSTARTGASSPKTP